MANEQHRKPRYGGILKYRGLEFRRTETWMTEKTASYRALQHGLVLFARCDFVHQYLPFSSVLKIKRSENEGVSVSPVLLVRCKSRVHMARWRVDFLPSLLRAIHWGWHLLPCWWYIVIHMKISIRRCFSTAVCVCVCTCVWLCMALSCPLFPSPFPND